MCTGTPQLPFVVLPGRLFRVNASTVFSRTVHGPRTRTIQLRLCKTQLSRGPYAWYSVPAFGRTNLMGRPP
jgi:hypothetical protein